MHTDTILNKRNIEALFEALKKDREKVAELQLEIQATQRAYAVLLQKHTALEQRVAPLYLLLSKGSTSN